MKSFFVKIKNSIPYFFLIMIYFFFVNIEAKNNNIHNRSNDDDSLSIVNESVDNDKSIRIPVIPFKE